jgi:predicted CopG family antitoxin
MKSINIYFEDEEYNQLIQKKQKLSWHDFILLLLNREEKE